MATKRNNNVTPVGGRDAPQAKPKVFIGSSTKALPIARAMQLELKDHVQCEVDLWSDIFAPGMTTLANLLKEAEKVDFAVFIFHTDDVGKIRNQPNTPITRDNVVFEYGIFMSALGHERTIAVRPAKTRLAELTDDAGFTYLHYDMPNGDPSENLQPHVRKACVELQRQMSTLGLRNRAPTTTSGPFAEVEKSGITHFYEYRRNATDQMLIDIESARESVRIYARVYLSELVKHPELPQRLALAASKSNRLVFRWVSCDIEDELVAEKIRAIENDPQKPRWPELADFLRHMRQARLDFDRIVERVFEQLGKDRIKLQPESRSFDHFVPPYSMVLVDERIAYVSLYRASGYGTYSPTFRIDRERGKPDWIGDFLPAKKLADPPHVKR